MDELSAYERYFKKFVNNPTYWLPEGIIEVDLEFLKNLNLLDYDKGAVQDPSLTRYFHVIETEDKITLVNDNFIVWIVPDLVEGIPMTYTLIAINQSHHPKLETAFSTSGVYNTSRLVLRILEKQLSEIQETEQTLLALSKKAS